MYNLLLWWKSERNHQYKSKTSSSKKYYYSDSENEKLERNSMRAADHYQPDLYHHPKKERKTKETKVDLPHFHGTNDIDTFLDWEMKVEQLFECYDVSEKRKVPLATLSFQGHALHWWTALVWDRLLHHEPTIVYWNDLKSALRRRHIPSYYTELMDKLHNLNQKNISIEKYRQKMKLYMMRAGIREHENVTVARFLNGLSLEIRDKVELLPYRGFHDLVQICIKVEQKVLRKGTSQSSYSNSYSKTNYEREGKSLSEKPRENPTKAIVKESGKREKEKKRIETIKRLEKHLAHLGYELKGIKLIEEKLNRMIHKEKEKKEKERK